MALLMSSLSFSAYTGRAAVLMQRDRSDEATRVERVERLNTLGDLEKFCCEGRSDREGWKDVEDLENID
jgi:hypothetical protein